MTEFRRKRGWINFRIAKITEETHDTKTFFLVDDEDGTCTFDYIAGQYLTFRYDGIDKKPVVRSYTMSSSPRQKDSYAVTVKRVEGGLVSNWMCDQLKVGDILKGRGAIGKFVYDAATCEPNLTMIAAGSGVTPFVSILREYGDRLGSEGAPKTMNLLVAYRSRADLILWDELERLNKIDGINVFTTLSRDSDAPMSFWQGRPDTAMLDRATGDNYENTTFMTCGPEALMALVINHCLAKGADSGQVHKESFF